MTHSHSCLAQERVVEAQNSIGNGRGVGNGKEVLVEIEQADDVEVSLELWNSPFSIDQSDGQFDVDVEGETDARTDNYDFVMPSSRDDNPYALHPLRLPLWLEGRLQIR